MPIEMLREELDRLTDDPDPMCHPELLTELSKHHPNKIRIIEIADRSQPYTCFMHVFGLRNEPEYNKIAMSGSGKIYANSAFVLFLIQEGYIQEITSGTTSTEDIVIYFASGVPQHAGIAKRDGQIESKWGLGHLYEHGILEVPSKYGNEVKFYSPISKGLALKHFLKCAKGKLETGAIQ